MLISSVCIALWSDLHPLEDMLYIKVFGLKLYSKVFDLKLYSKVFDLKLYSKVFDLGTTAGNTRMS